MKDACWRKGMGLTIACALVLESFVAKAEPPVEAETQPAEPPELEGDEAWQPDEQAEIVDEAEPEPPAKQAEPERPEAEPLAEPGAEPLAAPEAEAAQFELEPFPEPEADAPRAGEPALPQQAASLVEVPPPRPPRNDAALALPPTIERRWCEKDGREICKPMKIVGGVALGVGIASVATGLGFVFVDNKPSAHHPRFERMLRPAGIALIGVGMLVSTFGAFLVGEAIQRKRAPNNRFARASP